jgi:hypothetical protein
MVRATIRSGPRAVSLILALACGGMRPAQAADRFVSPVGSDAANDCLSSVSPCRTVGYGLTQAASGDVLKIAVGMYVENVTVSSPTTLTLSGGWANDFSAQDPVTMPTLLQAATQLPVVTILATGITIGFTADGFTIQGGKNLPVVVGTPCQEGDGGGICAQVSAGGSLSLALSRVVLQRNLANGSGGGLNASGFGVSSSLTLSVTDSTVTRNAAHRGGGINIDADDKATVDVTLDQVLFKRNRAGQIHGVFAFSPDGGGLSVIIPAGQNANVLVQNSIFESNRAIPAEGFGGQGGVSLP